MSDVTVADFHREYGVPALTDEITDEIRRGYLDRDELRDDPYRVAHERADGSAWAIYTYQSRMLYAAGVLDDYLDEAKGYEPTDPDHWVAVATVLAIEAAYVEAIEAALEATEPEDGDDTPGDELSRGVSLA